MDRPPEPSSVLVAVAGPMHSSSGSFEVVAGIPRDQVRVVDGKQMWSAVADSNKVAVVDDLNIQGHYDNNHSIVVMGRSSTYGRVVRAVEVQVEGRVRSRYSVVAEVARLA